MLQPDAGKTDEERFDDVEHNLLDELANIHQDQAANNQQIQATNHREKTDHLKKKSRWWN